MKKNKMYTCDCGNKAEIPICYECFVKGLENESSNFIEKPVLYTTNELTGLFIIKVFAVMFIIGVIAYLYR